MLKKRGTIFLGLYATYLAFTCLQLRAQDWERALQEYNNNGQLLGNRSSAVLSAYQTLIPSQVLLKASHAQFHTEMFVITCKLHTGLCRGQNLTPYLSSPKTCILTIKLFALLTHLIVKKLRKNLYNMGPREWLFQETLIHLNSQDLFRKR